MKKCDIPLLKSAQIWAEESHCNRLKVGAVIAKENRIISIGYNGTPQGLTKNVLEKCNICNNGIYNKKSCFKCDGIGYIKQEVPDNDCEIEIYKCLKCNEKFMPEDIIIDGKYKRCPKCNEIIEIEKNKYYQVFIETNPNVIHAEMNAILFAAKQGISTFGATMYVTYSPCINCAKHILQAGIKRVVYIDEYRKTDGIELLKSMIDVQQIKI